MVDEPHHLLSVPDEVGRGSEADDPIRCLKVDKAVGGHLRQESVRLLVEW